MKKLSYLSGALLALSILGSGSVIAQGETVTSRRRSPYPVFKPDEVTIRYYPVTNPMVSVELSSHRLPSAKLKSKDSDDSL